MLKLGRAQGVAMAAALNKQLPVFGYSPRLIKQSITGKGGASKEQVAAMIQRILHFEQSPKYLDATDAVGVALCHYFQTGNPLLDQNRTSKKIVSKSPSGKKSKSDWGAFVRENPGRTT
jgi:crossover junction endodeoxyribonuclease RuvC